MRRLGPVLLLLAGPAARAQVVQPLVRVGDAIPGAGSVVAVESVQVTGQGNWVAEVATDDPAAPRAMLIDGTLLAKVGDPLWFLQPATVRAFRSTSFDLFDNPTWVLDLAGTGGTSDDQALLCGTVPVLRKGKPAHWFAGFPGGSTFASFEAVQHSINNPTFVLRGTVDDPAQPGAPLGFLASGDYGGSFCALSGLAAVALSGQTLPGFGQPIEAVRSEPWAAAFSEVWPQSTGAVLWSCDLAGPTAVDGCVLRYDPHTGAHTLLAREGFPSPVPGRDWGPLDQPALDLADWKLDWTLRATLDASDPATDGIVVLNGAKYVQEGDTRPAFAPHVVDDLGQGRADLDSNGRVLWYAHWNDPAPASAAEAFFLDDVQLIRPGVTTVAGVPIAALDAGARAYSLGPRGHAVAFTATLADGTSGAFWMSLGEVSSYCNAKLSSKGCYPVTSWSGPWASASSGAGFTIRADSVLSQVSGLLFYGTSGPLNMPFNGGVLCVAPPLHRLPVQSSGGSLPPASACDGVLVEDFDAWIASGADPGLVPGVRVNAQFWYRDPGFAPPKDIGLTRAIELVIQP